ncbi:alpha/beta hydrolase [Edaphovirga cremea]|uniref:alpha/beta hydrolase n=1 Tax=Edaphovirga cremea TaxID=2267246 RepID=UPI00398902BF
MNQNLVIMLHGVGSNGDDLAPLGQLWKKTLSNTQFISPNAPFPFEYGPGYEWFGLTGVTEHNRAQRVKDAREAFDSTLNQLVGDWGFSDRLDRVAFVGFSQGSIMALDAVVSGRWPIAAVVAFSGRLSSPTPLTPLTDIPLLLIHGEEDPVIPPSESTLAAEILQGEGFNVTTIIQPHLGHTVSAEGAQIAGRFLAQALAAEE